MAMRPQTGRYPGRAPRAIPPTYEDFRPLSEWKQEEGADVVLFYLPAGFLNHQIKITSERAGFITVRGECPAGVNKRIRFHEGIVIPENCNLGEITANFENQILTIRMPKMIITQVGPKVDPIAEKPVAQPTPKTVQERTPPKASTSTIDDTEKQRDGKSTVQNAAREPKPQKEKDETPPKRTTIDGEKQIDGKSVEGISPQRAASQPKVQTGQDETPPKATTTSTTTRPKKQTEEKSVGLTSAENVVQKTEEKKEKGETNGKPTESKKTESAVEKSLEKESNEPITMAENVAEKTIKKEKEKSVDEEKAKEYINGAKMKETESVTSAGGGVGGWFTLENYKQAVKRLGRGLNEETELMVNMGVASLVIVALGAYIAYTFGSSGKANN